MFIDTSAIVAVLALETDAPRFASRIDEGAQRNTGAHCRLEACMNMARILGIEVSDASALFDGFLEMAGISIVPVTDAIARRAVQAFDRFGKGRHPAQLNFGDCLSYACAVELGAPILCKGRDFARTDLRLA